MKTLKNIKSKIAMAAMNAKHVLQNNKGMEVVQVLIIVIVSITLGALLLGTLKSEFTSQLGVVSTKLSNLFN